MRRAVLVFVALGAAPGTAPGVARAEIVDRVEIAVGNKVITMSDIELRIRLTSFENGETPDFSLAARRIMGERLIDQKVIEREMEVGHYPRIGAAHLDEIVAAFEKQHYPNPAALRAALAQYGLTEADLRQDLARQADLLTFLSLRFRPGANAADDRLASERADREMEAWLEDQRKRTKIDYPDADLAPGAGAQAK